MMWVGPAKQLDGALIPLYIGLLYKVLNNAKVLYNIKVFQATTPR